MKEWIKQTFTDGHGVLSFKRQLALILSVALIAGIFKGVSEGYIDTLSILVGSIIGVTGAEKFTKK